jgi:hypothetical protein
MLMSPAAGGGGSAPDGKRKRPVTGEAFPVENSGGGNDGGDGEDPNKCQIEPDRPMEVVFKAETFRKLLAWTLGPLAAMLVGGMAAFFYFYADTNAHKRDGTIHLKSGERGTIETKKEAKEARAKLETDIKKHFDLKTGQIGLRNEKQITKIGTELRAQQKVQYHRLLREIKKAN